MVQRILFLISYGALLLLLMLPTDAGLFLPALLFALGAGVILHKRCLPFPTGKRRQYSLIPVSILIAAYLGLSFYDSWDPSGTIEAIAALVHISNEAIGVFITFILVIPSFFFLYTGLQILVLSKFHTEQTYIFPENILLSLMISVMTVIFSQNMIEVTAFSMGYLKFCVAVLIVWAVILFLYCLFGRILPSILLGAGSFLLIATVNVFVCRFRGRLFEPVDLFSASTAMNVMDNYSLFPIPLVVILSWGIFIATLIAVYHLQRKHKPGIPAKKRLLLFLVCTVCGAAVFFYAYNLETYHWQIEGAQFNGYVLDFISKFKEISMPKPDNYSTKMIDSLALPYSETEREDAEYPHIIVIMDEAFSDLGVLGDFSTSKEVMPFISSLKENTISGYTLTSVYGGNTANAEYEFLTGHSLAWLSPNVVPYQQYIRSSTYSMASYLKSVYNYKTLAMHPYHANNWNRPTAYNYLGFEECYFKEYFPHEKIIRKYVSDQEMFESLIETFEAQKENPLFIFGVTMQNHGGYTYKGDHFTNHILLDELDGNFPEVEQYLSLIHETDLAVEYLINYFRNVEEDVLIVFFGDHQPKLEETFYETIGATTDSLDDQQKRYQIPFFIWANYDLEHQSVACTSLNYLSSYVYDAAGIALPPYNRFLREMEAYIPSINANGYYSPAAGHYVPFAEAQGEESTWLERYKSLQYNNLFDTKHLNEVFFPVLG